MKIYSTKYYHRYTPRAFSQRYACAPQKRRARRVRVRGGGHQRRAENRILRVRVDACA